MLWWPNDWVASKGPEIFLDGKVIRNSYWQRKDNVIIYLDFLKQQLGGTLDSLYNITRAMIKRTGGMLVDQELAT